MKEKLPAKKIVVFQMKQFGTMFNIVTQECFQRCVYSLTDSSLKNDEVVKCY